MLTTSISSISGAKSFRNMTFLFLYCFEGIKRKKFNATMEFFAKPLDSDTKAADNRAQADCIIDAGFGSTVLLYRGFMGSNAALAAVYG